ncbi:AT-rich interactive domain-containing protein 5A [Microcaecilia unicolor]|uniref:AT-rich interactive domain-containing protein 5A-like n=1 Tax=Microcaecilia unicolor TaxID=1415580 RepID=A0A6P7X2U3_9AMPH|nr:AT-rich interactive domain-containing protein 5A-like [Microcaecilia unicolor]
MLCSTVGSGMVKDSDETLTTEKDFVQALYQFMKDRHTPIERIPKLGFKQIDLFLLYKAVHGLGGYDQVTLKQQWRKVYNEIGGNPCSTSAATCTRKHYERMILPYERQLKGEEDHPDLLSKTVKRCSRGLYKDQISEQHRQEGKKPRLGKNSKKNSPYMVSHEPVTRLVPSRDQRLWQQELQEVLSFSRLTPPLPAPLTVQANHLSSPQRTQCSLVNQQTRLNTGPLLPQESKQRQQQEQLVQLAKRKSIAEEEELPLNLCSKQQTSELLSKPDFKFDSSSSPKCTIPKFLNQVSPLYPTHLVKKVENQVISPGNGAQGSLLLPVTGNHTQHNAQFLMKLKGKDISEARRQISLNLNSSHHSKKIPYVKRSRHYSISGDNS